MESHTLSPRRQLYDKGLRVVLYFCGFLTCALLVLIIGYIFYRGVPFISWELLSTQSSYINDTIGILPNILNTLYIILLSMVIVLPLGVGAAIYLTVGESAALLYTAGFGLVLNNFVTALESSSATLTVALYVYASERGETDIAFAIATILMLLTLVINLSANLVGRKLKKN